ncbi:hypothetical protein J6590_094362, partial [Homalodisca vitripennis]
MSVSDSVRTNKGPDSRELPPARFVTVVPVRRCAGLSRVDLYYSLVAAYCRFTMPPL